MFSNVPENICDDLSLFLQRISEPGDLTNVHLLSI